MNNKENLPALDNIELRELGQKKLIETLTEGVDYLKTSKRTAKISMYYLLAMLAIILLFIGGGMAYLAVKSGSLSNFIDNNFLMDNMNTRINCTNSEGYSMIFREPTSSHRFKQTFEGSECHIFIRSKDGK